MPLTTFTVSATSGLVRSDSVARKTLNSYSVSVPNLKEECGLTIPVANDSTPVSVEFGSVTTANVVFIYTDEPVTVKFNGDTTGLVVDGVLEILGTAVTSMTATNSGDNQARFEYYLAGEA